MKKRTLIVIVVLIVVALIAAACVYGYVSGRQQAQEEPPVSEPEKPTEPEGRIRRTSRTRSRCSRTIPTLRAGSR